MPQSRNGTRLKRPKFFHRPRHVTDAQTPWRMSRADWVQVAKRTWAQVDVNNVGLIAAGVAFYCFTAIVPTLASIVLTYGLLADPETVSRNITELFGILPQEAAKLISDQLVGVVETSAGQQGVGLLIALGIAFYGVTKATSSMIIALNVAYDEKETRGFIWLTVLSFLIVFGGLTVVLTAFAMTATLAFLRDLIPQAPTLILGGIRIVSYLLLATLVMTATACLYRYAPNRPLAKWRWLSPGALISTAIWLGATAAFGFYASNFGNYNATYGSLGAVIVLLTWLWLSSYVFLIGAELNGQLERQTTAPAAKNLNENFATDAGIQELELSTDAGVDADHIIAGSQTGAPASTATNAEARQSPKDSASLGGLRSALRLKVGARAAGAKLDLSTALLAGAGLARLRRGSPAGIVIIASAAAMAWLKRERRVPSNSSTPPT